MDDYDPIDVYMKVNESKKKEEDEKYETEIAPYRLNQKRDSSIISMNSEDILANGLKKRIDKTSFGMQLLEKMGYKEGDGLGKEKDGIKEPIEIRLKNNKLGVGLEEEEKKRKEEEEKKREIDALRQEIYFNMKQQQYQKYVLEKASIRQLSKDVREARNVIQTLDEDHGVSNNKLLISNDCEDVETMSAYLGQLMAYLRSHYFYCIYCGCAYNDASDLNGNCPGWDRSSH